MFQVLRPVLEQLGTPSEDWLAAQNEEWLHPVSNLGHVKLIINFLKVLGHCNDRNVLITSGQTRIN